MGDYRRQIAYIYQYDNRMRGRNAGFVKVENRGSQFRIQLYLRHVGGMDHVPVQIFGIRRVGKTDQGRLLGELELRDGEGSFVGSETVSCEDEAYSLRGLYLQPKGDDRRYLAGIWEGTPFDRDQYQGEDQSQKRPIPTELQQLAEQSDPEEPEPPAREQSREELNQKELSQGETEESVQVKEAVPEEPHQDLAGSSEEAVTAAARAPLAWESGQNDKRFDSPVWSVLSRRYGQCRPFAEDNGIQCIQIKPMDLNRLAPSFRSLSGNSFVMHAYYRYDHLLLIRMEPEIYARRIAPGGTWGPNKAHYFLGVPGYYHSSDKNLAGMFGFPDFLTASARAGTGEGFGYWYMEVELP